MVVSGLIINDSNTNEIKATTEHPFLVNNEWVRASDLQVGDNLTTIDGKQAKILSIEKVVNQVQVYNFETQENNYVAEDLVVHNSQMVSMNKQQATEILQDASKKVGELNPGKATYENLISSSKKLDDPEILLQTVAEEVNRLDNTPGKEASKMFSQAIAFNKEHPVEIYYSPLLKGSGKGMVIKNGKVFINSEIDHPELVYGLYHELAHNQFEYRALKEAISRGFIQFKGTPEEYIKMYGRQKVTTELNKRYFDYYYDPQTMTLFFQSEVGAQYCKMIYFNPTISFKHLTELDAWMRTIKFSGDLVEPAQNILYSLYWNSAFMKNMPDIQGQNLNILLRILQENGY